MIIQQKQPEGRSLFPVHATGVDDTDNYLTAENSYHAEILSLHIRVNDPDFDVSASGEDTINENTAADNVGPVKSLLSEVLTKSY